MVKRMAAADPAPRRDRAAHTYAIAGQTFTAPALPGGLYLVATPIGNLRDVTLRALEILAAADLIACEDPRVTRKLLDHFAIAPPLTPYHDHNAATARPRLLREIADYESELVAALRPGDAVMVKGSLGSRMGPIVKALERRFPRREASATMSAPA